MISVANIGPKSQSNILMTFLVKVPNLGDAAVMLVKKVSLDGNILQSIVSISLCFANIVAFA